MTKVLHTLAASLSAAALLALPASAAAQWDWDWYDGWEYEYGEREYGYALDGLYDDDNPADDWYYDVYDYGIYDDADTVTYDADLFGDDEWEPETEGPYDDLAIDASGDVYSDEYDEVDGVDGVYDDDGWEYDADLFGDDEWEYGEGNDLFDGYGYYEDEYQE